MTTDGSLIDLYRDLHAHPELAMREHRTAARLAAEFRSAGLTTAEAVGGTGVVGVLRNGDGPTVLLCAGMDALPRTEETGLPYASVTPGVMHACGHDLHVTALAGAAGVLARSRDAWSGTLVAVARPGEETGEGTPAMLADGLFERFPRPDVILSQHVGPAPVGNLGHRDPAASGNAGRYDPAPPGRRLALVAVGPAEADADGECAASARSRPLRLATAVGAPGSRATAIRAAHEKVFGAGAAFPYPTLVPRFGETGIPCAHWFLGATPRSVWRAAPGDLPEEKLRTVPGNHAARFAPDLSTVRTAVTAFTTAAHACLG